MPKISKFLPATIDIPELSEMGYVLSVYNFDIDKYYNRVQVGIGFEKYDEPKFRN